MPPESYWKKRDAKLTARAKRIWRVLFKEPFPKKWQFVWYFLGATDHRCKQLLLVDGLDDMAAIDTLVHEFVHVKFPHKRHGKGFDKMVRMMRKVAEGVK